MNDRIAILMYKARALYRDKDLPYEQGLVEYSEKLAELIVRECADIGNKAYSDVGDYTYIGDKIKKHFGVE